MAYRPYIKNADGTLTDLPLKAEIAVKVGTSSVGNTTTPVYINNGVPTACSESIPAATTIANLTSRIATLEQQVASLQTQINNMLNGTTTFTYLKAKVVDLVD